MLFEYQVEKKYQPHHTHLAGCSCLLLCVTSNVHSVGHVSEILVNSLATAPVILFVVMTSHLCFTVHWLCKGRAASPSLPDKVLLIS